MKTYMPSATTVEKKWYVVDATDMTLGRLASNVANVLRGKTSKCHISSINYIPFSLYCSCTRHKCFHCVSSITRLEQLLKFVTSVEPFT